MIKQPVSTHADNSEVTSQDFLLQRFPGWSLAHWCIVVAAVSFLILAFLPEGRLRDSEVSSGSEAVLVARSLAAHGTFADPFATLRTGPTAHVAPVYPFLYSLALRVFGTGYTALQILWACNVGFFALQMGLLPLVSFRLHLGILPGIVAAALGDLSLYAPIDTRWESFFAGTLLLAAFLASERAFRQRGYAVLIFAGVLWGLLVLTNPVTVLLLAGWALAAVLLQPRGRRAAEFRRPAILCGVALLVIAPWIGRNYSRFGSFIFVRDNLGIELYTSNNPCAAPAISENIQSGCHARTHPNPTAAVAAQLRDAGEVQYNRARLRDALDWISAHPAAFLNLTVRRLRLFWLPELDPAWPILLVWVITLASVPGLWLISKQNPVAAWFIASAWLLFPLVYYVTQFDSRYRYPILWTSLLPAGCAILETGRKLFALFKTQTPRAT